MCSTICPCLWAQCFSFLQIRDLCKAPSSSSHQNLISGFVHTGAQRSEGSKGARLSAPVHT